MRLSARHPHLTLVGVALLAFVLAASWGVIAGIRLPFVHDEFSYLLAADTFASGRLTNPPHPHAVFFEAPQILVEPTYASKYPPAQGLVLALGQALFGHPIVGVWIGFACATAALTWSLRAALPSRWALLGGVAYALTFATHSWSQSYWGGHVAACGGMLVAGGALFALRRVRATPLALLALGLVVLAGSRPFEGLAFCIPFALAALCAGVQHARSRGLGPAVRVVVPAVLVLAAGAAGTLQLNAAVTGDALRMPYAEHTAQYQRKPTFVFQEFHEREYRTPRLARFYGRHKDKPVSWAGLVARAPHLLAKQALGFVAPPLLIGFLLLPLVLGRRRRRPVLIAISAWALTVAAMTFASHNKYLHYAAPVGFAAYLLCVEGLRRLRTLRVRGRAGRISLPVALFVLGAAQLAIHLPELQADLAAWRSGHLVPRAARDRTRVEARLAAAEGPDVVFVRQGADFTVFYEWVYNAADIDGADIVWAHDRGDAENSELRDYFADRTSWRLEVGAGSTTLERYEPDGG